MTEWDTVQMEIQGLVLDPTTNAPIVILRDTDSQVLLPIWIGPFEANAIAVRMEGIVPPRPLTHDLLRTAIEQLGAGVQRIVISDLRDSTFYAVILLRHGDQDLEVDARPSDAIALALRTEAPIFVNRSVLEKARSFELSEPGGSTPPGGGQDTGKYMM